MSKADRERVAPQAAIRTIRSGGRPLSRILSSADGSWSVLGYEWLAIDAKDRRSAVDATRAAVAEWLDIDPEAFDVEAG